MYGLLLLDLPLTSGRGHNDRGYNNLCTYNRSGRKREWYQDRLRAAPPMPPSGGMATGMEWNGSGRGHLPAGSHARPAAGAGQEQGDGDYY